MASYEYIESALILNLDTKEKIRDFKYGAKDFAKHGDAYNFLNDYFDKYGRFPSKEDLCDNYPTLDGSAYSSNFEYSLEEFKQHVLERTILSSIREKVGRDGSRVKENPKKVLSDLMVKLTDIDVDFDEDVEAYDDGNLSRLDDYKERTRIREMGEGLMGVRTSHRSINTQGVGGMPGDLVAAFARPTIGKTWLCVHAAATAVVQGKRTLLVSSEMPIKAINMRMDVVLGRMLNYNFSHRNLRYGEPINEVEYQRFLEESNTKSLLVCDHIAGEMGISLNAIAGLIRKHNPEFVVIDGVYLISVSQGSKQAWEQSHMLFYGLKNLATSTNTPILVSTQANRDASSMFRPPKANEVAFGDALIRASDVAISMCKVKDAEDKRLVQFQKYRDGYLHKDLTAMQWDINYGDIKELEDYPVEIPNDMEGFTNNQNF